MILIIWRESFTQIIVIYKEHVDLKALSVIADSLESRVFC